MKATSQKSLYNSVFNTLVKRFDCWEDTTIVRVDENRISIKTDMGDVYPAEIKASMEVTEAYEQVFENANVYAMFDKSLGFVVNVSLR